MLEWESLAEALQRVVSVGVGIEAAKREICDHVAQDLIRARVLPAGSSQSNGQDDRAGSAFIAACGP